MLTQLIAAIRARLRGPTLEEQMRTLQHRLIRNERRLRRLETLQEELRRRCSRGETTGGYVCSIPLM